MVDAFQGLTGDVAILFDGQGTKLSQKQIQGLVVLLYELALYQDF